MPYGLALLGLGLGGSVAGGLISGGAAGNAAALQARAANNALQLQGNEFQQISQQLQPYEIAGTTALSNLQNPYFTNLLYSNPYSLAGPNPQVANTANQPQWNFQPLNLQTFQQSPGYQWQLSQGENAIQNSATGKTGAIGGNTLEALQTYGTGLANQDWWNAQNFNAQNYINQYNARNQAYTQTQGYLGNAFNQLLQGTAARQSNVYNILAALAGGGQNAATNQGGFGQATALSQGNYLTQGANAGAAGQIGQANAFTGGINNVFTQLASAFNPNASNSNLAYLLGAGAGGGGYGLNANQAGVSPFIQGAYDT